MSGRKRQKLHAVEAPRHFGKLTSSLTSQLILQYLNISDMMRLGDAFKKSKDLPKNFFKDAFGEFSFDSKNGFSIFNKQTVAFMQKNGVKARRLTVDVQKNALDGPMVRKLLETCTKNLEALKILNCNSSLKLDCIASALSLFLPELRELSVSVTQFNYMMGPGDHFTANFTTDSSLIAALIQRGNNLRKLEIFTTKNSNESRDHFENICMALVLECNPHLEYITLHGAPHERIVLETLRNMRQNLRYLSLDCLPVDDPTCRVIFLQTLTIELETLLLPNIYHDKTDTTFCLHVIQRCGQGLKHLELSTYGFSPFDGHGIRELADRCPNLETLNLAPSYRAVDSGIIDEDIDYLARHCTKLRVIKLWGITERSLSSLLQFCPQIEEIDTYLCSTPGRFDYYRALERLLLAAGRRVKIDMLMHI